MKEPSGLRHNLAASLQFDPHHFCNNPMTCRLCYPYCCFIDVMGNQFGLTDKVILEELQTQKNHILEEFR